MESNDNDTMTTVKPNYVYSLLQDGALEVCVSDNLIGESNNNKTMKEEKLTNIEVVFVETKIVEYTYNILAENLEDAKEKIANGNHISDKIDTILVERVIK